MLTHIVHHIFRMARPANFKLGIRLEKDDPHHPQAPWPPRSQGHVISLSRVGPWAKNRKWIVVVSPKLAGGYPHDTCYIVRQFQGQKIKRSKVRVTGRLTQKHKMCHIFRTISSTSMFRTVRPKNFKVGERMVDVSASAASAMTSNVKSRGHKLTSSVRLISAS